MREWKQPTQKSEREKWRERERETKITKTRTCGVNPSLAAFGVSTLLTASG